MDPHACNSENFQPITLQPIDLSDDIDLAQETGIDYNQLAENIVLDLDRGRFLLDNPELWYATLFHSDDCPIPSEHMWFWRWLTSGAKRIAFAWPGDHGKTVLKNRYVLWRLLRCPDYKFLLVEKDVPQSVDCLMNIQTTVIQPEFIELHGFVKPARNKDGAPWSVRAMRFDQMPQRHKTHSLTGWGIASNGLLGQRGDEVNLDDLVTPKNCATPTMRENMIAKENEVMDKCIAGSEHLDCQCGGHNMIRQEGTPFWHDDSLMHKKTIANITIDEDDWSEPEGLSQHDKDNWIFIEKTCWKGMTPGKTLWDFRYSKVDLELMRDRDPDGLVAFKKRMECKVRDETSAPFHEAWFRGGKSPHDGIEYPGCLNRTRILGQVPAHIERKNLVIISAVDPQTGKETKHTDEFCHTTLCREKNGKKKYLVDGWRGILRKSRAHDFIGDFREYETQIGMIVTRHHKYACGFTVVEINGQQEVWVDDIHDADPSVTVERQYTGEDKHDPYYGVTAMATQFELGLWDLPYGDDASKGFVNKLIEQYYQYPDSAMKDIVMNLWFGNKWLMDGGSSYDSTRADWSSPAGILKREPLASRSAADLDLIHNRRDG